MRGRGSRAFLLGSAAAISVLALSGIASEQGARAQETASGLPVNIQLRGKDGTNGRAYWFSHDDSTPGQNGPDLRNFLYDSGPISLTPGSASSTAIAIGTRGGRGGDGSDAGFQHALASPAGHGGSIEGVRLHAHLAGSGDRKDPTALVLLESLGGQGGGNTERRFGRGGDGGTITLELGRNPLSGPVSHPWEARSAGDNFAGVWARSVGGDAGRHGGTTGDYVAVDTGGHGGTVKVTVGEGFAVRTAGANAPGVILESRAGAGSTRGNAFYTEPRVTNGGQGGAATFENAGLVATSGSHSAAVIAQSIGGHGGDQNDTSDGGQPGGLAGAGGTITIRQNGGIATEGDYSFGVAAQSVGGTGGHGSGGVFGGGTGGAAGNGGAVEVSNRGIITTQGEGSSSIVAQSVGGGNATDAFQLSSLKALSAAGGGVGGRTGLFGKGGEGGTGGAGGAVTVRNGGEVLTSGDGAHGIIAQSIGGGGGNGGVGNAFMPLVAIALGGGGGGGGNGGAVRLDAAIPVAGLTPSVTTFGKAASGILLQSVGGSGGTGGSARALSASGVLAFSLAVGGAGGKGGDGGTVGGTNLSDITTHGTDSSGLTALSIGGGGGLAGNASSYALAVTPPGVELPSISVSYAIGGSGGDGGKGGMVEITNQAGIHTLGTQSYGLHAMSVGGGGGKAGAASAVSNMVGSYSNIGIAMAIGGTGGKGGDGARVEVTNAGTVETNAPFSTGILAQSVGGGGGAGGNATTSVEVGLEGTNLPYASYLSDLAGIASADSMVGTQTVGGQGGDGGQGSVVKVTNQRSVETHGTDATAIFAQSVGGGGGTAGGYQGGGKGTTARNISVGGQGGGGGGGGAVTVTNEAGADILTHAAGAHGIVAQSVGGGGGAGGGFTGKQGSTAFSADGAFDFIKKVSDELGKVNKIAQYIDKHGNSQIPFLNKKSDFQQYLKTYTTNINLISELIRNDPDYRKILFDAAFFNALHQLKELYKAEIKAIEDGASTLPNISVQTTMGGAGGGGGAGGEVTVTNSGRITTEGANAWGVIAQSVGGGGGLAGAAISSGNNNVNLNMSVGGSGGRGGQGGDVSVSNHGTIVTGGGGSHGLFAQSVGGGGGAGGGSSNSNGISLSVNAAVGGSGGAHSDGGSVTVKNHGQVTTGGDNAHGIFAQSVGGGGGTVFVNRVTNPVRAIPGAAETAALDEAMQATLKLLALGSADGGTARYDSAKLLPTSTYNFTLGGSGSSGGTGGTVDLTHAGTIVTRGAGAFGIFGQSIGGGGGAGGGAGVAERNNQTVTLGGTGGAYGQGGAVALSFAGRAPSIETSGTGASAVFLQSVGGGGGYVGTDATSGGMSVRDAKTSGDGGAVTVSMADDTTRLSIRTAGDRAHGIHAQSIGGGGGFAGGLPNIAFTAPVPPGTTRVRASGAGGGIVISTRGDITATGRDAFGILAQTGAQTTTGAVDPGRMSGTIAITHEGTILGGSGTGAGIRTEGGTGAAITLKPGSEVSALSGTAISSLSDKTEIRNSGLITGDIVFERPGGKVLNQGGGTYRSLSGGTLRLQGGTFENSGTVDIGGAGQIGTLAIEGTYRQTQSGAVIVDVRNMGDAEGPRNDSLRARDVSLQGTIRPNVSGGLLPGHYRVVEADTASVQHAATVESNAASPISWTSALAGRGIDITPQADFVARAGADASGNDTALLRHLQEAWDTASAAQAPLFAALANVGSAEDYRTAIDTLSPEGMQAPALARTIASHQSMSAALSCPVFADAGILLQETDCVWARFSGSQTRGAQSAHSDGFKMSGLSYRVGAQREMVPGWFAGITAAYGDSWFSANDGYTKSEGTGGDVAVSLKHQRGPWLFAVSTHLGYKSLDNVRRIDLGSELAALKSASEVWTLGARLRASRQFVFTDWYLKPRLDLDILHTRMPAFAEKSDAPYSLRVGAMEEWTPVLSPAVEIGGRVDLGESTSVHPYLSLGASFMRNERLSAEAWFKGTEPGVSRFASSVKMPGSLLDIGLGVQLFSRDTYELRAEAKSRIGRDFVEQEGSLRFSVRF